MKLSRLLPVAALCWSLASPAASALNPPRSLTRLVRYGEPVVLKTAILRTTALILNADESLLSIAEPDAERWQIGWAQYGPESAPIPVVTVTPTDCGLTTNIAVLTTKRIYPVLLRSPRCDRAANDFDPQLPFDALVRYRYPAEAPITQIDAPRPKVPPPPTLPMAAPLEQLLDNASHFRWRAKRHYRGALPVLITDDGHKTFISFRRGAFRDQDLPLLFLVRPDNQRELVSYQVEGSTFVVPRLFRKAILVQGSQKPKKQPHLLITRLTTGLSTGPEPEATEVPR